jgi:tyrosyl-tRNA synthetase
LKNLFDVLQQRGFLEKTTDDVTIRSLLEKPISGYIGFDPTASSLHVGSLIPIMALAHMQRQGHRPIALVGGATALVGDPSGKTEMRQMLTSEDVNLNAQGIKKQLARFIEFEQGQALLLNNAEWLTKLEYIPFLRDIGRHFSVNRMLASESCRLRLETGLSFIEFNYALLQAYDFLHLYRTEHCVLQLGGADQWGNIVAGLDLIRRMDQGKAHGITFPLITTSSGAKMGKTAQGAVWLDPVRTTPYEYYQFWVNTDDGDVARFMALFTFLPMDQVGNIEEMKGVDLNSAKTVLAFEATKLAHGPEEATKAYHESARLFGSRAVPKEIMPSSALHQVTTDTTLEVAGAIDAPSASDSDSSVMPSSTMEEEQFENGIPAFRLFHMVGLAKSGGAARRLIQQGGGYVNNRRIDNIDTMITRNDLNNKEILLRAGKKRYHRIRAKSERGAELENSLTKTKIVVDKV